MDMPAAPIAVPQTGAFRFAQRQVERQRRLAPAAHPECWAEMRNLILISALVLAGCRRESVEITQEAVDATGTNRLVLYNIVGRTSLSSRVDYDFHSLAWQVKAGTNWTDRLVISQSAFQGASPQRRWVNQIAAFDGSTAIGVLKVGEESKPITNGNSVSIHAIYSWREWSLLSNTEVRVVRICRDPFEKY